jgi:hypothetical protein
VPWIGAAVSLWIFKAASGEELVWAGASLAVGAILVFFTVRARGGARGAASPVTKPGDSA